MSAEEQYMMRQRMAQNYNNIPMPRSSRSYEPEPEPESYPEEDYRNDSDISEIDEEGRWNRYEPEEGDSSTYEINEEPSSFDERFEEAEEYQQSPIQRDFHQANTFNPNVDKDDFSRPPETVSVPTRQGGTIESPLPSYTQLDTSLPPEGEDAALLEESEELKPERSRLDKVRRGLKSYGQGVSRAEEVSSVWQGDPFMGNMGAGGIAGGIAGGVAGGMGAVSFGANRMDSNYDPIFGNMASYSGGSDILGMDSIGGGSFEIGGDYAVTGNDPIFGNMLKGGRSADNDMGAIGMGSMNPMDIGSYVGNSFGFAREEMGMGRETLEVGAHEDFVFGTGSPVGYANSNSDDLMLANLANYDPMAAMFGTGAAVETYNRVTTAPPQSIQTQRVIVRNTRKSPVKPKKPSTKRKITTKKTTKASTGVKKQTLKTSTAKSNTKRPVKKVASPPKNISARKTLQSAMTKKGISNVTKKPIKR